MFCNNCGNQVQPFNKFCPRCGVPMNAEAPTPPPPQPPPYQPASSFGDAPRRPMAGSSMGQPQKKSGCGKILLIVSIILLLIGGGIAAAIYYGYNYAEKALKSSEAYGIALAALKDNPHVAEKMGDIKDTGFPLGSFSENGDGTGAAAYRMSVQGTKASGYYNVVMRRQNRKWRLITGSITLNNGETIDVMKAEDSILGGDETDSGDNSNTGMPPPPTPMKPPADAISGGVLNAKAIDLPKPTYPATARAVHASGTVVVQVLVDESGNVMTAQATSGHPLLRQAAVAAAKQARFTPTKLSGRPVKVSGVLTYNFEAQ
ncbi:MAG TPA: TonB family protein [Pyrinomonadaceae bacterium]|jgi:TonB family protein|nr:TonB family protein [Pyrinomonadaceae bacterium]